MKVLLMKKPFDIRDKIPSWKQYGRKGHKLSDNPFHLKTAFSMPSSPISLSTHPSNPPSSCINKKNWQTQETRKTNAV